MSTVIFQCEQCSAPFLASRRACCPPVFQGIVNCGPLGEMKPNWQTRADSYGVELEELRLDRDWIARTFQSTPIGKYLPGAKKPGGQQAYERCCRWSGFREGVVLDFGCCLAHGSMVFKEWAPDAIYIGADHEPLFLAIASAVYDPGFLYLSRRFEDRSLPLRHIASNSIDLLISSCLTNYDNCAAFLAEWRRVLKPGGLLHLETHNLSTFADSSGSRLSSEPYPTPHHRRLIVEWLNRHFVLKTSEHSLADFLSGRTRLAAQFQLLS